MTVSTIVFLEIDKMITKICIHNNWYLKYNNSLLYLLKYYNYLYKDWSFKDIILLISQKTNREMSSLQLLILLFIRIYDYAKNESNRILYIILWIRKINVYKTGIAIFKLLANLSKLAK